MGAICLFVKTCALFFVIRMVYITFATLKTSPIQIGSWLAGSIQWRNLTQNRKSDAKQWNHLFFMQCDCLSHAKIGKMTDILILSVLIIAIAAILLCVKVIFKRGSSFSSMHIHDSEAMKERGIHCVLDQDREQRKRRNVVKERREHHINQS